MQYKIIAQHYREKCPHIGDIVNGHKVLNVEYRPEYRGFNECYLYVECKFCGTRFWAKEILLKNKSVSSCGCIKTSKGEAIIEKILKENNVKYEKEKIFKDCYFSNIKNKCKFDFWIEDSYVVEFDGLQHFKDMSSSNSWFKPGDLEKIQQRDQYKNNWCHKNNIPIIRIPYTEIDNITIDYLKLDTTKFLLNKEDIA